MTDSKIQENDPINPRHYKLFVPSIDRWIECKHVIEAMALGYHLGCALKYMWRLGVKHERVLEDIGKCRWYLDRWQTFVFRPITLSGRVFDDLRKITFTFDGREVSLADDHSLLAGNLRSLCDMCQTSHANGEPIDTSDYMLELIKLLDLADTLQTYVDREAR
jgi:hypothetical protein